MKTGLEFNPLTHSYRYEGRPLPSVTGIISTVIPRQWNADEWCLERGRMVHRALALYLDGNLDFDSLDPRIVDRVQAGIMAIRAFGWKAGIIEQPMVHPVFLYCGMPDFISDTGDLCDWKGIIEATVEIQLGFYALLAEANKIKIKRLFAIQTADKGYKAQAFDLRRSKALAVSFLGVYGWMAKQ